MFSLSKVAARCGCMAKRSLSCSVARCAIQFEPPYLDAEGPEVPEYPLVNVQMKGYDFTVLEHYGKWVHNTALNMDIDVEDSWATPCQKLFIQTYKPKSAKVEAEYNLQIYERTVQLADLPSIMAPLFIDVIQAGLPQGVELTVLEHMPEHTKVRYIPDLELKDLQKQLGDLGGSSKK
ncbi:large ribosomal subunit protein mL48 isoform X2 [Procambarus clarkii]|uniref:large ribosomal subunit protein mL48 isoform X2 n=1 Tax=Procambarus clarkii TaxID=6728 RepID=UPI001E6703A4|nr:39S ribosomal protein L48, mitochondrial-like isoform X2 [Procambarus clarkii]XP_045614400.1 39S ribosomal protein L48, mitochondrial-like isoform X2 [Procambarus clarkii]